nr:hypothetical protein [Tanacetum cinerariifolium]
MSFPVATSILSLLSSYPLAREIKFTFLVMGNLALPLSILSQGFCWFPVLEPPKWFLMLRVGGLVWWAESWAGIGFQHGLESRMSIIPEFKQYGTHHITTKDEEDEVQIVRPSRPMGRAQAKRQRKAMSLASSAASVDIEALGRLKVNKHHQGLPSTLLTKVSPLSHTTTATTIAHHLSQHQASNRLIELGS